MQKSLETDYNFGIEDVEKRSEKLSRFLKEFLKIVRKKVSGHSDFRKILKGLEMDSTDKSD